jgi:hypothetical protein
MAQHEFERNGKRYTVEASDRNAAEEAVNIEETKAAYAEGAMMLIDAGEVFVVIMTPLFCIIGLIFWPYLLITDYGLFFAALAPLTMLRQAFGKEKKRKKIHSDSAFFEFTQSAITAFWDLSYLKPVSTRFLKPALSSMSVFSRRIAGLVMVLVTIAGFYIGSVYYSYQIEYDYHDGLVIPEQKDGNGVPLYSKPLLYGFHQGKVIENLPAGEEVSVVGITRFPLYRFVVSPALAAYNLFRYHRLTKPGEDSTVEPAKDQSGSSFEEKSMAFLQSLSDAVLRINIQYKVITKDNKTGYIDNQAFPAESRFVSLSAAGFAVPRSIGNLIGLISKDYRAKMPSDARPFWQVFLLQALIFIGSIGVIIACAIGLYFLRRPPIQAASREKAQEPDA